MAPRFAGVERIDPEVAAQWRSQREAWCTRLDALMDGRVLVMPTTPVALLPRDTPGEVLGRFYEDALTLNALAGIGGLPQITVPLVGEVDEPLALSFVGARHSDRRLLALVREVVCKTGVRT
jgi:amidase